MSSNFKKLAIAAGVSAGLAAVSVPSYAVISGPVGEALLVPLVAHGGDRALASNTIIQITIPATVGFDGIPNNFTAPHTTPTNPGPTLFPVDADLAAGNFIHWYWFDKESVHRLNRMVPVTADDVHVIDWLAASGGAFAGEEGYMVIGTETARTGAAADFAMFGEAWFELYDPATGVGTLAPIPVLPMSDGEDGAFDSVVSVADNVKYTSSGIPRAVSPQNSGNRPNPNEVVLDDTTVFNLALSDRNFPSVHVVWLDVNLGGSGLGLGVDVFDSDEVSCSGSVNLPYELNVIWVPQALAVNGSASNPFGIPTNEYCLPTASAATEVGFVTYYIPEYVDNNIDEAESAGVAFSILMDYDAIDTLRFTTSLGQERGTYK